MSVRSLNKVLLIGNLTRDPELRYTTSGTAVVTFGLATNRSWKDQNGEVQESTQFHNIVAWNKMAEICNQLLAKGMKVYVEGELMTRSWVAEDGQTKYKTEIRINDMMLLDSKGRSGAGGSGSSAQAVSDDPASDDGSDDPAPRKKGAKKSKPADEDNSEDVAFEDPTMDESDLPF